MGLYGGYIQNSQIFSVFKFVSLAFKLKSMYDLTSNHFAASKTTGPRPLKVVAAKPTGDVKHFTDEI